MPEGFAGNSSEEVVPTTSLCPPGLNENPLETVCIPCGTRINGCTDPRALNYYIRATHDDGSCVYLEPPTIHYGNAALGPNISFTLIPTIGGGAFSKIEVSNQTPIPSWLHFEPRTGVFSGVSPSSYFEQFNVKVTISNSSGSNQNTFVISYDQRIIYGCTNPKATNYNPLANQDNGSCVIVGCRDPEAPNYDPEATIDGFCVHYGCTNPKAINYNLLANVDDGTCVFCRKPYISITPLASAINWEQPLLISGKALYTPSVQVAINSMNSRRVEVQADDSWRTTITKGELDLLPLGSNQIQATTSTDCGSASETYEIVKPQKLYDLPMFIGITASTGSSRSIQTIGNFKVMGKAAKIDPQYTSSGVVALGNGYYQLTANLNDVGGGVWSEYPVNSASRVEASFDYTIGGDSLADGFALIFSTFPFLAGLGGGFGYQFGNTKSIAIEVDSYENPHDPDNSHIAVIKHGNVQRHYALSSVMIRPGGNVKGVYDSGLFTVYFNGEKILEHSLNLFALLNGQDEQ
jgi:hypothetical protein